MYAFYRFLKSLSTLRSLFTGLSTIPTFISLLFPQALKRKLRIFPYLFNYQEWLMKNILLIRKQFSLSSTKQKTDFSFYITSTFYLIINDLHIHILSNGTWFICKCHFQMHFQMSWYIWRYISWTIPICFC